MKPLTGPRTGLSFGIWRLYFNFNFARSWTWARDKTDLDGKTKRTTELLAFCIVQECGLIAFTLIVGPIMVIVGFLEG